MPGCLQAEPYIDIWHSGLQTWPYVVTLDNDGTMWAVCEAKAVISVCQTLHMKLEHTINIPVPEILYGILPTVKSLKYGCLRVPARILYRMKGKSAMQNYKVINIIAHTCVAFTALWANWPPSHSFISVNIHGNPIWTNIYFRCLIRNACLHSLATGLLKYLKHRAWTSRIM